jgi:putative ABC transport system permease protein
VPLLLSLAWRNSASRRERSLLSILAIALGVGLILGTQLINFSLQQQLSRSAADLVGNADAEVFAFSDQGFGQAMVDVISKLPEVKVAAPVVTKRLAGDVGGRQQTFQMLGIDPIVEAQLHPLVLASGKMFAATDKAAVLLDQKWAGAHGVRVGDSITLFTALGPDKYVVKGLLKNSAFAQSSFGAVVFVPLQTAQKAFRLGAKVTQVSVALKPSCVGAYGTCTYNPFRNNLRQKATEEYSVQDNRAFIGGQRDAYAEIAPVLAFFSLLALGIGLFLIYNNLAVTVLERRREIGLLRAAGATPSWIRNLFLLQAGMLGLTGTILGLGAGILLAAGLVGYLSQSGGQSDLSFVFDPGQTLFIGLWGILATLLSALLPAVRAMSVAPLEAIRPQSLFAIERSRRRTTWLGLIALVLSASLFALLLRGDTTDPSLTGARLLVAALGIVLLFLGVIAVTPVMILPLTAVLSRPFQLLAPGEAVLARNALIRHPNRSALTIAGLVVSTALVVAVAGLTEGALGAGTAWVDSLFVSDHLVVSPVHQTEQIRQEIAKVEGVRTTSEITFFSLRAGDRALSLAAIDPLDYSSRGKMQFVPGTAPGAFTDIENSRAMVISRRLADTRQLHAGDHLSLTSARGEISYRVAAIVNHTLPSPSGDETALISLSNARLDFGIDGFNILQVIPAPGVDGSAFNARLSLAAAKYGMQAQTVADVRAGVRTGVDSLLLLLTGIGLVGVILGLMSVVTTILLNISESSRELGLLRAVGATRAQVRGIILTQSGLFGLCGAVLGAAVGLVLIEVMLRAASSQGFQPGYSVPWSVIAAVIVVAVVGSLLAVVLPARRAASASVIASLRYE